MNWNLDFAFCTIWFSASFTDVCVTHSNCDEVFVQISDDESCLNVSVYLAYVRTCRALVLRLQEVAHARVPGILHALTSSPSVAVTAAVTDVTAAQHSLNAWAAAPWAAATATAVSELPACTAYVRTPSVSKHIANNAYSGRSVYCIQTLSLGSVFIAAPT